MSNVNTGAPRTPHDLSHLVFSCGKMGRLQTLSCVPVMAGDSFEQDLVGSFRLSPMRRGLAVDSMVDIFTFYVPHRHIYGDAWITMMEEGVASDPITDTDDYQSNYAPQLSALGVNAFANSERITMPKWLWAGYQNIWNNYFKVPYLDDNTQTLNDFLAVTENRFGLECAYPKSIWTTPLPPERGNDEYIAPVSGAESSIDLLDLNAAYGALHSEQERQLFMTRYRDVMKKGFGGSTYYDADNRPQLKMRSTFWASGYDVDGTDQTTLGQFTGRVIQSFQHRVPRCFVPEHGMMWTVALPRFPVLHDEEVPYFIGNQVVDYETYAGDPAISGNHPPVDISARDFFYSGVGGNDAALGIIPHSQWYRYHPSTIHSLYRELQGYPFLSSLPSANPDNLYIDSSDYDDMFGTTQLGHWNMQARNNVTCMRHLPTALESAMTNK